MATIDESALTAAKVRDMPISPALRRVLLMAAQEAGVEIVRITSGGQPGSWEQRIGSNRHGGGNAADLELVAAGRTLDFTQAHFARAKRAERLASTSGSDVTKNMAGQAPCQDWNGCRTKSRNRFWNSKIAVRTPVRLSHHRSGSKVE
jgi:hypothetical protein